jgi:hypothetical protein
LFNTESKKINDILFKLGLIEDKNKIYNNIYMSIVVLITYIFDNYFVKGEDLLKMYTNTYFSFVDNQDINKYHMKLSDMRQHLKNVLE